MSSPLPLDAIIGIAVGGGVLLCGCCVIVWICSVYLCVRSHTSRKRRLTIQRLPKFRVLDAPNQTFLEDGNTSLNPEVNWSTSDNDTVTLTISNRRPASLPPVPPPLTEIVSSSEYSYALPNEFRVIISNQGQNHPEYATVDEIEPLQRPRAFSEGEIEPIKRVPSPYSEPITTKYGSTSPTGFAEDYCSPVPSISPTSPKVFLISSSPPATDLSKENLYMTPATNEESLYMQIKSLNVPHINRICIQVLEPLGSGNFGNVMRCVLTDPSRDQPIPVAAKTLKLGSTTFDKTRFLQEAAIMGQFHHPNIVQLLGVVTVGTPIMIVLEMMSKGDLRNYILKIRPEQPEELDEGLPNLLLSFCHHIASGMEYLSKKNFIHRDLAARNILLSQNLVCKVGDFGMARDLMDEEYYISQGGKIPVKWTSPEALNYRKYSTSSDVWSFGCLMYEIWSLGHKPFEGKTNTEALQLVEDGYRLPPPPGCPRSVYEMMIQCWHQQSNSRPSFKDLVTTLSNDSGLLNWSESDKQTHKQATLLGANLDYAENLYIDLQLVYV